MPISIPPHRLHQLQHDDSALPSSNMHPPQQQHECVGSLVVNAADVQELSSEKAFKSHIPPTEMVGSLLVEPKDMQEFQNSPPSTTSAWMERIAKDIHSPTPDDFDPFSNHS